MMLEYVVRDGGSGLSKGIAMVRAERPELKDGLDVFHTLYEGGKALRQTWAAAARGLVLMGTVRLQKDPRWREMVGQVRRVLRGCWRASSLVEGINSVTRMHQSRHRRMTQGLLDLKRLYWNMRAFRTASRSCFA